MKKNPLKDAKKHLLSDNKDAKKEIKEHNKLVKELSKSPKRKK
jgi:hypothetical protein